MDHNDLKLESIYFTDFFFKKEISDAAIAQYILGNDKIFRDDPLYKSQIQFINKIVASKSDIEALEYAWRLKDKQNILSKKIRIIFYILEVKSDYFPSFVNTTSSFSSGTLILLYSVFKSLFKLLKGTLLLRKYGIV